MSDNIISLLVEWNGLLYSGGVQLTIAGSNLNLVQRPQMNVSVIFSFSGEPVQYYNITVRKPAL